MSSLPLNKKKEIRANSALKAVVLSSKTEYRKMTSLELLCSLLLLLGSLSLFSLDFSLFFLESNGEGGLLALEVLGPWLLALDSSSSKQQAKA